MRAGKREILRELRERGRATRPELAAVTGLSAVSVGKAMAELCREGVAEEEREAPSTGGRPALIYRYCTEKTQVAYFQLKEDGAALQATLEFMDPAGKRLRVETAKLAHPEPHLLDALLNAAAARRHLLGISLLDHPALHNGLAEHLAERYACPVRIIRASDALADERDDNATLYLARGKAPQCTLRRGGTLTATGALGQIPLPARWETLDYTDHTLVEEMVARLLIILSCTLAPKHFTLHADFWNTKLVNRIRYNANAKLSGKLPPLHFRLTTPETADSALRRFAAKSCG